MAQIPGMLVVESGDVDFFIFERLLSRLDNKLTIYRAKSSKAALSFLATGLVPGYIFVEPILPCIGMDGEAFFTYLQEEGYFTTTRVCLLTALLPLLVQELCIKFPFFLTITKPFTAEFHKFVSTCASIA